MKIYTIEESCYEDLNGVLEKMQDVVRCAKKVISEIEHTEMGSRKSKRRYEDDYDEEDDYDWRIKKGHYSRY